jgi:hypothetical protein
MEDALAAAWMRKARARAGGADTPNSLAERGEAVRPRAPSDRPTDGSIERAAHDPVDNSIGDALPATSLAPSLRLRSASNSPLTEKNRRSIVKKWYAGEKQQEIERDFRVSNSTVWRCIREHEARVAHSIATGSAPWLLARGRVE